MNEFSKEDIELLVFHDVVVPLNKHRRGAYWKFPEYTKNDTKGFKKVLESIKNIILANEVEKEWRPILTRKLSTSETDFSDDSLAIIGRAKKVS